MTKDKTQRVRSYISGAGVLCYETEQYNAKSKDWYIVGDVTDNYELARSIVDLHNKQLMIEYMQLNNQKYADRIIEVAQHFNDYTTSDLQGVADAIVLDIVRDCSQ